MKLICLPRVRRGQALTEFIVVALVLVPLMLLIPMIAKYQDMAHAAQLASRYVAFEAMTRNDGIGDGSFKPAGELAHEASRRFFGNADAPIKTGDAAGDFKAHQNMYWRDHEGKSLIRNFGSDVMVTFGQAKSANHSGAYRAASDTKIFDTNPFNLREEMGLKGSGIYTANVSIKVANLESEPGGITKVYDEFKNINLVITRSTSLVTDTWTASGPEQAESRIDNDIMYPAGRIKALRDVVGAAVVVIESPKCLDGASGACDPRKAGPQIGHLDTWRDVVPADRLQ